MASYVLIWENNTFGHQKVKNYIWPGHAAINIGDDFDKGEVDNFLNSYVSWFPTEGAGFGIGNIIKSLFTNQKGGKQDSILQDVDAEGYLPDHVIKLNSSHTQENMMRAAWRTVFLKPSGSSYKNLRKNCSTIVSRVLHAAGYYAYKWAVDTNFAWTPADVRALADESGGTHMTWTDFLALLAKNGIVPADFLSREDDGSLRNVTMARSGVYCSTGAPVEYQKGQTWQPDKKKRKK